MSKPMKTQGKLPLCKLIENQLLGAICAPDRAARRGTTPFAAARPAARQTPPGGAPRAKGLPLAQRPAPIWGQIGCEK